MGDGFRVAQLSDTHFLDAGAVPEGGFGYDTAEAFDAVLDHLVAGPDVIDVDLVVVTGDIADHGQPSQYEVALAAFDRLPAPVHLCPGNHDLDAHLRTAIDGTDVHLPRVSQHGPWAFVYVDTNAGAMVDGDDGRRVDPPGDARLHRNGTLGSHETAWLSSTLDEIDAEHVFVWLHHPPHSNVPMSFDAAYAAEWTAIADRLDRVRGFGGGHTHVPSEYRFLDRPVFVAPALKTNFDLEAETWLPPGYRTYEFHDDGTVESAVHLIDDDRWPRRPYGRALRSLFAGELTFDELEAIIARKAAAADAG